MQPDTQCHKFKKNYKFIFIYYSLCFRPTSFIVFEFKYPWSFTIYREFHTFFYIWREDWMCLMSDNFMPFYWIRVGFSLKIIVLIGDHCYTNFNINIQILNVGAEFERCLWLHVMSPALHVKFSKQCACLSYVSCQIFFISLWTK